MSPDITMCQDKDCPLYKKCYRAQAIANEQWQSYFTENPKIEKKHKVSCEHYIPIRR